MEENMPDIDEYPLPEPVEAEEIGDGLYTVAGIILTN